MQDSIHIEEENELERLLKMAADEPAHRPEFLRLLLESSVYVLGTAGQDEGSIELEAGSEVALMHWQKPDGSTIIPFFSSQEMLEKSIDQPESYLHISTHALFSMTKGAHLVLNPKWDWGKEFVPEEIEHLLEWALSGVTTERRVEEDTSVMLGQPTEQPAKMMDSLSQLFAKHPQVKRAFLALMHDPSQSEAPSLIVGIETEGSVDQIIREAAHVASDTAPKGVAVDLCRVSEDEQGLSQYFLNETKPFYEKSLGSKIKSMFGFGRA
jgi:hypothetical protein